MGMIRAEKLVFEYDKRDEEGNVIGSHRAIDGVDIDVPQGSFVAILGHCNRCMAGILDCLCTNPTVYRNSGRYACVPWFIKRSPSGTDTGSNA